MDVCRPLHPTADDMFFSNSHGIFTQTDHILGHKTNLNKLKRIETIQSLLSDQNENGIKLEISIRNIAGKSPILGD